VITPDPVSAADEWRRHWLVVVAATGGVAFGSIHIYSLGVLMSPLEQEFGWSRTQITSGLLITSVISVLLSPLMGMLVDRIGPRRIVVVGLCLYSLCIALLSQATGSIYQWWLLWLLLACSLLFIKPTAWVAAISSLFTASRGLALALLLSGTGLCSLLTPLITEYLVNHHGWRTAYLALMLIWLLPVLPLVVIFFTSRLDQQRKNQTRVAQPLIQLNGMSARAGFRSPTFYKLAGGAFLMALASVALVVNLIPILTFKELPRGSAVAIAGLVGAAQVTGRLLVGYLVDRFNARLIATVCVLLPAVASLTLVLFPVSTTIAIIAVIILGLSAGGEMDAAAYLASRHFGMRSFGTLFGTMTGIMTLGIGLGPVCGSYIYDLAQSYDLLLWLVLPFSVLSSLLFWSLGSYPSFANSRAATA
jgi:MFS family permease